MLPLHNDTTLLSTFLTIQIFYYEGGETLQQAAKRSRDCSITGSVGSQAGQGFEQPDLEKDVSQGGWTR